MSFLPTQISTPPVLAKEITGLAGVCTLIKENKSSTSLDVSDVLMSGVSEPISYINLFFIRYFSNVLKNIKISDNGEQQIILDVLRKILQGSLGANDTNLPFELGISGRSLEWWLENTGLSFTPYVERLINVYGTLNKMDTKDIDLDYTNLIVYNTIKGYSIFYLRLFAVWIANNNGKEKGSFGKTVGDLLDKLNEFNDFLNKLRIDIHKNFIDRLPNVNVGRNVENTHKEMFKTSKAMRAVYCNISESCCVFLQSSVDKHKNFLLTKYYVLDENIEISDESREILVNTYNNLIHLLCVRLFGLGYTQEDRDYLDIICFNKVDVPDLENENILLAKCNAMCFALETFTDTIEKKGYSWVIEQYLINFFKDKTNKEIINIFRIDVSIFSKNENFEAFCTSKFNIVYWNAFIEKHIINKNHIDYSDAMTKIVGGEDLSLFRESNKVVSPNVYKYRIFIKNIYNFLDKAEVDEFTKEKIIKPLFK